jgi:hypothetical protein
MLVEGPFGTGKTTFAIETLFIWLEAGIPPEKILVLVPQRTLAQRYLLALRDIERGPAGLVDVRTHGGMAKEACEIYWPVIAAEAGFQRPELGPRFLTIETAQYVMADFVSQAVQRGEFDAVNVSPQQIARQVIDNLGKAALMGIDYRQIPDLLGAAWGSERPRKRVLVYEAVGRVAHAFRQHCLEHRLLDYSLQVELFTRLLQQQWFSERLFRKYTYLVVDHLEEETPPAHDLVDRWMPYLEGGLFIYEWDSGYRVFLGADPDGGAAIRSRCDGVLALDRSYLTSPGLEALLAETAFSLNRPGSQPAAPETDLAFSYSFHAFFPQMLDWVADTIAHLVHDSGIPPGEIAVLAPFLSDALRFSLGQKLDQRNVPHISHRPSRALRDEPAARTLLTLAALAHPHWGYRAPQADVAAALDMAVPSLDPIRSRLLAKVVYHPTKDPLLAPFDQIKPSMQARITYQGGQAYEYLRGWLVRYAQGEPDPLDQFLRRLFGEVVSQPGFGFHDNPEAARITDELVESARKFRQSLFADAGLSPAEIGRRYFSIVQQGLLSALYVGSWRDELADAVFMAPAYTFLMRNRSVRVQFWLDVGSTGWWERLDQPLTHPYVLSPAWPAGQVWTDADEYARQQDMLYRIMSGLIRRTREHIYLGISDLGEQGYEQRGPMLRIFQQILRRHPQPDAGEAAYG